MMWLRKAAAKIVYGHKSDEKSYARWLRQQGVAVGRTSISILHGLSG